MPRQPSGLPLLAAFPIVGLPELWVIRDALVPADPVLRWVVYTALVLMLTTVLVMAQVLLLSILGARGLRQRRSFERTWRPLLAQHSVIEGSLPASVRAPRGRQRLWLLALWNRTQRQLRGEARERLNFLLAELGLDHFALRQLRRPGIRRRLLCLDTLRYLGDPAHWGAVEPWLHSANTFVSISAGHALVSMDATRAMRVILPLALQRRDWAVHQLSALCRHAGRAAVTPPLLEVLQAAASEAQHRLVGLLASAEPAQVAPWARAVIEQPADTRDRQAALHALGELADPRDRDRLRRVLADEDAGVRLAALQAFRRLAQPEDRAILLPLLEDSSWWVRQQAADALVSLPGFRAEDGPRLLAQVRDRYGHQALERALAERPR